MRADTDCARLLVKSWETGVAVEVLEIQESLRPTQAGLFTGGGA